MKFKNNSLIFVLGTIIFFLFVSALPAGACTGFVSVGSTSDGGKTISMKVRQSSDWIQGMCLYQPKDGYKILAVEIVKPATTRTEATKEEQAYASMINEKGVSAGSLVAASWDNANKKGIFIDALMMEGVKYGGSAKEAVEVMNKIHKERGLLKPGTGGNAILVADPKEVINYEVSNNYRSASAPVTDGVFARANVYLNKEMAHLFNGFMPATGGSNALDRQKRAEKLLKNATEYYAGSQVRQRKIGPLQFMKFARDQEYKDWLDPIPDSEGSNICSEAFKSRTVSAHLAIGDKKNPDMLSVLWVAMDTPTMSPFVPFYIGITKLHPDWETTAANLKFGKLRQLVWEYPAYRNMVISTWESFELRTYLRSVDVEKKIVSLIQAGKKDNARSILNDFVYARCDEALGLADGLIKKIEKEREFREIVSKYKD